MPSLISLSLSSGEAGTTHGHMCSPLWRISQSGNASFLGSSKIKRTFRSTRVTPHGKGRLCTNRATSNTASAHDVFQIRRRSRAFLEVQNISVVSSLRPLEEASQPDPIQNGPALARLVHQSLVSRRIESHPIVNNQTQSNFRTDVIARDGVCLLTEVPHHKCTAAHIVPYSRPDVSVLAL
jgi:hypothetical protein